MRIFLLLGIFFIGCVAPLQSQESTHLKPLKASDYRDLLLEKMDFGRDSVIYDLILKEKKEVKEIQKSLTVHYTTMEKFAIQLTNYVGSFTFFLIIFIWTFVWLLWNIIAPKKFQFDRPGFLIWLFSSNIIQIFLMPLIMVGQNLSSDKTDQLTEDIYKLSSHGEVNNIAVLYLLLENKKRIEEINEKLNNNTFHASERN